MEFPRKGELDPQAGVDLARSIQVSHADIPILLQSRDPKNQVWADQLKVSFLLKGSPTLLKDLGKFMKENFSFGDFVFSLADGTEVGRAKDLRGLEKLLHTVPDESILFHGERNHFSNWLKARTEFLLAYKLRPRRVSDYTSVADVRQYLIRSVQELRVSQQRGSIVDFDRETFDPSSSFARIGGGSLGGKGRGLAFVNSMIYTYLLEDRFDRTKVRVPAAVVVGTDVFDQFMLDNNLWDTALMSTDDDEIERLFLAAEFSDDVVGALRSYLELAGYPVAVRSSSLLEDSQYQPFAGIYRTCMLPNNNRDPEVRLEQLQTAVKEVYASTFSRCAKAYIKATPYRLEEEKMAVVIQKLVGSRYSNRFYPHFAGVASTHNYYPIEPIKSSDGIAAVALGLGGLVMDGGRSVRFSPRFPRHLIQFASVEETLAAAQNSFYAVELPDPSEGTALFREIELDLERADKDGTLVPLASTYSIENHAIYDGVSREGTRIVTMAPVLKQGLFPLADILNLVLKFATRGMSAPVEIEFAVNLATKAEEQHEFCLLQMRPMVIAHEWEGFSIPETDESKMVCRSSQVLGDGVVSDIHDLVYVDMEEYERSSSRDVAAEIGRFNAELGAVGLPYILVGVGRWGSSDPWLGIPVKWNQISGARVLVEASFKDLRVEPSQGTHFFQNLISFRIGYFTIDTVARDDFLDWDWLRSQQPVTKRKFTRHLSFDTPIKVQMNGRSNQGVILKPVAETGR
jgi:hypothetical protein